MEKGRSRGLQTWINNCENLCRFFISGWGDCLLMTSALRKQQLINSSCPLLTAFTDPATHASAFRHSFAFLLHIAAAAERLSKPELSGDDGGGGRSEGAIKKSSSVCRLLLHISHSFCLRSPHPAPPCCLINEWQISLNGGQAENCRWESNCIKKVQFSEPSDFMFHWRGKGSGKGIKSGARASRHCAEDGGRTRMGFCEQI